MEKNRGYMFAKMFFYTSAGAIGKVIDVDDHGIFLAVINNRVNPWAEQLGSFNPATIVIFFSFLIQFRVHGPGYLGSHIDHILVRNIFLKHNWDTIAFIVSFFISDFQACTREGKSPCQASRRLFQGDL